MVFTKFVWYQLLFSGEDRYYLEDEFSFTPDALALEKKTRK